MNPKGNDFTGVYLCVWMRCEVQLVRCHLAHKRDGVIRTRVLHGLRSLTVEVTRWWLYNTCCTRYFRTKDLSLPWPDFQISCIHAKEPTKITRSVARQCTFLYWLFTRKKYTVLTSLLTVCLVFRRCWLILVLVSAENVINLQLLLARIHQQITQDWVSNVHCSDVCFFQIITLAGRNITRVILVMLFLVSFWIP